MSWLGIESELAFMIPYEVQALLAALSYIVWFLVTIHFIISKDLLTRRGLKYDHFDLLLAMMVAAVATVVTALLGTLSVIICDHFWGHSPLSAVVPILIICAGYRVARWSDNCGAG